MSKLTDYFSTWFVTDDSIQTQAEVAAAQQAALDRQRAEGKRGWLEHWSLSREIKAAGDASQRYVEDNDNPFAVVPWWIYAAAIVGIFWYLGGFGLLRGILNRK